MIQTVIIIRIFISLTQIWYVLMSVLDESLWLDSNSGCIYFDPSHIRSLTDTRSYSINCTFDDDATADDAKMSWVVMSGSHDLLKWPYFHQTVLHPKIFKVMMTSRSKSDIATSKIALSIEVKFWGQWGTVEVHFFLVIIIVWDERIERSSILDATQWIDIIKYNHFPADRWRLMTRIFEIGSNDEKIQRNR
jgi:hypothetical protein